MKKRCCPTCRQDLPPAVVDLWNRVTLAGHHHRCICVFCRGDVAEIVRSAAKPVERVKKGRNRKPRRPRFADYSSVDRVVESMRKAEREVWPVDPAVVRFPERVLTEMMGKFPDRVLSEKIENPGKDPK